MHNINPAIKYINVFCQKTLFDNDLRKKAFCVNSCQINTSEKPQNQTIATEKLGIFSNYFSLLKIGSLLNQSGITKTKGASPLELFTIVFNLVFTEKNFFEGVVRNKKIKKGSSLSLALIDFEQGSTIDLISI